MLSVLINQDSATRRRNVQEIETLFQRLKDGGGDEGRSFYTTRRVEYEWKEGRINNACKLIDETISKTKGIFSIHILRASIYLDKGNKTIAYEEIKAMKDMIARHSRSEGQTYLRALMEVEALYYSAIGQFDLAKNIYKNSKVFSELETSNFIKAVEYDQASKKR